MPNLHGFVLPHWAYWGWLLLTPPLFLYLAHRAQKKQLHKAIPDVGLAQDVLAEEDPALHAGNRFTRVIDWVSKWAGHFVAFWSIGAVLAYSYEVVSRQVFNLPTLWVHEASYLLFGMQYLLAGAFTLLMGGHVRVDVLYVKLPPRGRVGMDIFTSVIFFIFALALIGTSWRFFADSYAMGEVTMETWAIQHWPVKGTMFVGAVLITLAGVSKLTKDILLFRRLGNGG